MTRFYDRTDPHLALRTPKAGCLAPKSAGDLANDMGLTIHHTGYGGTLYHVDPFERLRGIQAFHMNTLGYCDIAYNGAFDADGNTFGLRDPRFVGAHSLSEKHGAGTNVANRLTEGIVYLEDARGWTREASIALAWWGDLYRLHHGRPPHFFAHRYWFNTECPGGYLVDVVKILGGNT